MHYQNKTVGAISLFVFITVAFLMSGFFAPQSAFAATTVLPASGGTNISIDTTSALGGSGTYKTLTGPSISDNGDIAIGTHTISLSTGWEFNTGSTITVVPFNNIGLESTSITPGQTSFSFVVTTQSTEAGFVGFSGIQVRPTGTTPSTGNMTYSGAGIVGVNGSTNFGTLSTVPGTVAQLVFATQPGNAVYGSLLNPQPVVVTKDQFGNNSTSGLIETEMVSLTLTGTGVLQGTASLNIGTGGGTPGTVTFTNLKVGDVGAVGTKGLTASAGTLTDAVSAEFEITAKPLTATLTADDKVYDGDNSATITGVELDGVVDGDVVSTNFSSATATFVNENAGLGKTANATGITLPSEQDALVFEYAKVNPASCDNIPYPIVDTNTFKEKGIVEGSAYAWLSSGPPGPCSDATFDANHMSLTDWKSTGTAGIDGATKVFRIEIEIDNWISQSSANISNIQINGTTYGEGQVTLSTTDGATAEWVGGVARLQTTGAVNTGKEARIVIQASDVGITTLDDLDTISWDVAGITGYLPHADVIVNIGNYTYDGTAEGTADITAKPITVTPTAGQTKVYGEGDPVFAYTNGPLIGGDVFTGALSRVAGEDVGTYAYSLDGLSASPNYLLTLAPGTFEITQKPLTVTATGVNREYNQTANATVTLSSVDEESEDNLVYAYTSASFLTKTAENGKTVNVSGISISGVKAGNYNLQNTEAVATANITKKPITATINVNNKTYNGDTNAVYASENPRVANGVIGGDTVVVENTGTKAFVDKHVDVGKTVNATGLTLSGADADNYAFDGTGTGTATINARPITVTAAAGTKVYNGTTDSAETPTITVGTLASGDTANFTQTYDNKNVGGGKKITPSGVVIDGNPILEGSNYAVTLVFVETGVISEKSINVTAVTDSKIYDGTTSSDEAPIVDLLETGDTVGAAPTQSYLTKDVDTGKTLTPSGLVINDGNDGANYTIVPVTNNTGEIEKKNLTVSGATTNSKTYDGGVIATVNFGGAMLVGKIGEEDVSLDSTDYSATYDNKNVATGKTVTVLELDIDGTGASNYSLTQPTLNDGVITEKTLTVTATGVNKVYNANTTATVTLGDNRVDEDVLTLGYTANFSDKNVANGKPVSVTGIAITGGADAGNYTLGNTTAGAMADITPANLTATITAADKTYDGNTSATITGRTPVDVIGSDEVILTGGSAIFEDANAGENKDVDAVGITLTGADALNYSYDGTATGVATIDPLGITGLFTANNKMYDGNTDAEVLEQFLDGVLPQDEGDVILVGGTAEFDDPNVDDDITVTASDMELDGLAADNYELLSVDTTKANITKAPLTITAVDKDRLYGDANPILTASYNGFVNEEEDESVLDAQVELSTTANEASPVGDYPITASGATDNNYYISFVSGTLTVDPAPIEITPDNLQGKIYGDSDGIITYTATGFKNGQDKSVFTGALGRAPGENAGDYLIDEGDLDVGGNYFIDSFFDIEYTIEQRELTVTAVTDTKFYDGTTDSVGTPTITVGSLAFSDAAGFTQSYGTEDVGSNKTLAPSGVVNDGNGGVNYSYTFLNDTTGVITAKSITITPDAGQSKVFGEDEPVSFTYTNTPALIGGDVFTGALGRVEGENVGTYAYAIGTLENGLDNYSLILVPGTFAITKATPEITWDDPEDIVYGTELDVTQLNTEANVEGEFVYTPVEGTVLSAGEEQELSVTFTPTDTANYNSAEKDVLITVAKAPLTVTADDKSKDYGEDDPPLTYEFSGLVNDDTNAVFSGALTRDSGEEVGEYDINKGTLSAESNYNISFEEGTFTIEDTVAPTLLSHTPSVNAVNVTVGSSITITFSEPVNVAEGAITLNPGTSFTMSGDGANVITLTPTSAWDDNTIYEVTVTEGVEDVNENALTNPTTWTFTTATSYSISLNADNGGWNLISLPVVPTNKNVGTVLDGIEGSIDAVWTYDPLNPNAVDGWLVYVPGNPEGTNNLTIMTAGYGYWISATGNATINGSGSLFPIVGPTAPPSRNLVAGWNLIGYYQIPGEESSQPNAAFASIGGTSGMNWLSSFNNTNGELITISQASTILPGDAFWVSLKSAFAVDPYTPSMDIE